MLYTKSTYLFAGAVKCVGRLVISNKQLEQRSNKMAQKLGTLISQRMSLAGCSKLMSITDRQSGNGGTWWRVKNSELDRRWRPHFGYRLSGANTPKTH